MVCGKDCGNSTGLGATAGAATVSEGAGVPVVSDATATAVESAVTAPSATAYSAANVLSAAQVAADSPSTDASVGTRTTVLLPANTTHTAPRTMNVLSMQSSIWCGFIDCLFSFSAAVYLLSAQRSILYFFHNTGENSSNTVKISRRPMSMTTVITHLATIGKLA